MLPCNVSWPAQFYNTMARSHNAASTSLLIVLGERAGTQCAFSSASGAKHKARAAKTGKAVIYSWVLCQKPFRVAGLVGASRSDPASCLLFSVIRSEQDVLKLGQ